MRNRITLAGILIAVGFAERPSHQCMLLVLLTSIVIYLCYRLQIGSRETI
jgi:hypothetical protein